MRVGHAVILVASSFLSLAPGVHGETGQEGWLRYAALPPELAQQYKIPHRIVATGQSAVAHSAASELARGLHSMLGAHLTVSSTLAGNDAFLLGTPAEIRRLLPAWKPLSPIAPEGFSLSQIAEQGHNYWVLAGGSDRGVLYGVFRILEQVAQQKFITADAEAPSSPIRWVNQWDNFDGSIERGYGGRSIFFDNGHVRADLSRVSEFGRLLASVGINGATVNNVNANLHTLDPEMGRAHVVVCRSFESRGGGPVKYLRSGESRGHSLVAKEGGRDLPIHS
jgi:alpha-glucuronidase